MNEEAARPDVFGSDDWRVWVETLYETLGVVVTVADLERSETLFTGPRGTYCQMILSGGAHPDVLAECFPELPAPVPDDASRMFCRAGMPCYLAPVVTSAGIECHVIIEGFVTSTRERRRLFEQMVARGSTESDVRTAIHAIPVFSNKRAEALARMVATHAATVLESPRDRGGLSDRAREHSALAAAMRSFLEGGWVDGAGVDSALEHAMATAAADEGSLMMLRRGTDIIEVAAVRGAGPTAAVGATCRVGEGIPGRVAKTGRSVLISGSSDEIWPSAEGSDPVRTVVCVPMMDEDDLVGVLSLGFHDAHRHLSSEELAAVETFASLAAAGLRLMAERSDTAHELMELLQVSELSRVLQGDLALPELMPVVASVLEKSLDFRLGGVLLTGHGKERATIVVRADATTGDIDAVLEDAAGLTLADVGEPMLVTHLGDVVDAEASETEWTVLSVALTVRDVGIGALFVASDEPGTFDASAERLLWRLAEQVGPAFDRALLFERLRDDYARTIAALSAALDANERREVGHSARVMDYAMAIAEDMGLGPDDVEILRFAGLLHDIGKVGVSDEILLKPSRLTSEEHAMVQLHSQLGATLLEQVEFLNDIAPVVLHHHERWDGGGYPMRLAGEQIPLLSRILAVADSYDAMTTSAPHRRALTFAQAKVELAAGAGSQFDPRVVAALLGVLDRQATAGLTGLLSEAARNGPQLPS